MTAVEVNFDGIVGPTHHYGGLSFGNVASQTYRMQTSYPRQAALEGLQKMKLLADLGVPQAVLPPHERPDVGFLRGAGFTGSDAEVIQQAAREKPELLSIAASASAMWAANAATVSPSADTVDGRVHFTPANLLSTRHRRLEPEFTTRILRTAFPDVARFCVHEPLPPSEDFADEGAANHMRVCRRHGDPGVEIFVYGRTGGGDSESPEKYPARQSRTASETIVSRHGLSEHRTLYLHQSPAAIDAGVFHNDVIAVANERLLLCHEHAYVDQTPALAKLRQLFPEVQIVEAPAADISLANAVETYLFNSQLVTLPDGSMLLLCPAECEHHTAAKRVIDRIQNEAPLVAEVRYVDVRQSMQNGGGPACLRLRVVLTEEERAAVHAPLFLTDTLNRQLTDWVTRHYRAELTPADLGDPRLLDEVRAALAELADILQLGPIYPFQQLAD